MIIFVNPYAAGGRAGQKWAELVRLLPGLLPRFDMQILHNGCTIGALVEAALAKGETQFVAAGGDGTVNALLNSLLLSAPPGIADRLILGAIGLGSSNDFHKPFMSERTIAGIPCMLEMSAAAPRDVGVIRFEHAGKTEQRFFLINASVGVTAEANCFFNHPDPVLRSLKRRSTRLAIAYTALRTIAVHRNVPVKITSTGYEERETSLTTLGIAKNPHFSGDLRYPGQASYENGRFAVHLCHGMNRRARLRLLRALGNGTLAGIEKAISWSTEWIRITGSTPFPVEYDGEVVSTRTAEFSLLSRHIKVCPC